MSGSRGRRTPRPGGATANGSLYERYKDALRRGHVAALRGRNEAAVDAYGEAASIAPDRALPHASIGAILVKMDRLEEAAAAFDRALDLAPRDEGALRGLAELHVRTGRRADAAATLDRLADSLDAAGRLADATDAARRALELAESRARRQQVEGYAARLRAASGGDEAAQHALDQVLRLLAPETAAAGPSAMEQAAGDGAGAAIDDASAAFREPAPATAPEPAAGTEAAGTEAAGAEVVVEPGVAAEVPSAAVEMESAEAEPEAAGAEPAPGTEPAGLGIALGAAAEAALYAGNLTVAHDGLLAAARAHRRAGRLSAAVDACYLAIGLAPSDPDLHILLAELYLDRGWRGQATDKILLLGRLADLDGDRTVRERLCALVAERLADEPRLAALCA